MKSKRRCVTCCALWRMPTTLEPEKRVCNHETHEMTRKDRHWFDRPGLTLRVSRLAMPRTLSVRPFRVLCVFRGYSTVFSRLNPVAFRGTPEPARGCLTRSKRRKLPGSQPPKIAERLSDAAAGTAARRFSGWRTCCRHSFAVGMAPDAAVTFVRLFLCIYWKKSYGS